MLKNPSEVTGKMDAKSKSGFFVGIEPGTKDTCRIWSGGKVVLSRNVTFLGIAESPTAETDDTVAELSSLPVSAEPLDPEPLVEIQNRTVDNLETAEHEIEDDTDDPENVRNLAAEVRRYPLRERRQPQPYWTANVCLTDPLTLEEALGRPQHDDWKLVLKVLKSWSLGGRIHKGRRPSFGRGPSRRMGPTRVLEGRCPFLQ